MDMEELKNMASDDKYLSGIYNYCDRWCERCSFTDRCLTYATSEEIFKDENGEEASLDKTMEMISGMFGELTRFLQVEAAKRGIDLNEEVDLSDYKRAKERAYNHTLAEKSYGYFKIVHEWFQSREEIVNDKALEFIKLTELGFDEQKIESNIDQFQDAIEVIRWYFTLIKPKLMRALITKFEEDVLDDNVFQAQQYNTAAKIALLGCQRSLKAWQTLHDFLNEDEDKILDILAYLDGLIKEIKKEFPEAEKFKRPYFD